MGASLLAIAVYQIHQCWLALPHREQARSHSGAVLPKNLYGSDTAFSLKTPSLRFPSKTPVQKSID